MTGTTGAWADCEDERVRTDPYPGGSEFGLLLPYLDYQRETMLSKTEGLTHEQLAQKHAPSELTLAGLLYHLSLVEEDWMEVRFAGLPDREPWAGVDWDTDPNWELRTATQLEPEPCVVATAKPASAAGRSCPTRQAWTSCQPRRCATDRTSRCGGSCCTSSRKPPVMPAMRTSSAKRSTARSVNSEPKRKSRR